MWAVALMADTKDPTWDNSMPAMLALVECSVTVICTSLMALKPLIQRYFPALFPEPRPSVVITPQINRSMHKKCSAATGQPAQTMVGCESVARSVVSRQVAEPETGTGQSEIRDLERGLDVEQGQVLRGKLNRDAGQVQDIEATGGPSMPDDGKEHS
jgi:hypothetical protein